jgi:hypothetical protein
MLSNIQASKQKNVFNQYDWYGLTQGKLMMLAKLCKINRDIDPLANNCYCEIRNFFYETDSKIYQHIVEE